MSSFSGTVQAANTRIFARAATNGKQFLVYQMEYSTAQDAALILPLPTPPDSAANSVRFIDLSGYPEFFADIEKGFPYTRNMGVSGAPKSKHAPAVGDYDATYLPSQKDLWQLDESFRIPKEAWAQLPEYNDFGFAVIKLHSDAHSVRPIALEFPMRSPQLLYFPTIHIQAGEVASEANFDHDLYCQARAGWLRSYDVSGSFVDIARTQGVVDSGERVSRMTVQGMHPNSDIIVGLKA